MIPSFRTDHWRMDLASAVVDDATGWMEIEGTTALEGVMDYGDHFEFVPIETLKDSIDQLVGLPVTLGHPQKLLDLGNTREFQIGTVLKSWIKGDEAKIRLRITDPDGIEAVRSGTRELSPGYQVDIEEKPGTFKGKAYKFVQKKRRYNHQAIVDRARGGRRAKFDSWRADGVLVQRTDMEDEVVKIKLPDGTEYEVPKAVAEYLATLAADEKDEGEEEEKPAADAPVPTPAPPAPAAPAPAPAAAVAPASGGPVKVQVTMDQEDAIADKVVARLQKAMREDKAQQEKAARQLGETVATCKPHLPQSYRTDGKDELTIMADTISHLQPKLKGLVTRNRADGSFLRGTLQALLVATAKPQEKIEDAPEAERADDDNVDLIEKARKTRDEGIAKGRPTLVKEAK